MNSLLNRLNRRLSHSKSSLITTQTPSCSRSAFDLSAHAAAAKPDDKTLNAEDLEQDLAVNPTRYDWTHSRLELTSESELDVDSQTDDSTAVTDNGNVTLTDSSGTQMPRSKTASSILMRASTSDGDLGYSGHSAKFSRRVHLMRTLDDALNDPAALSHFAHFLDLKNLSHLLKFWIHTESFRLSNTAALSQSRKQQVESSATNSIPSPEDVMNNNEQKPIEDEMMRTPRKREPVNVTTTMQLIKQDAVNIFSKYIAKDALHSIETTDAVRNNVINKICAESGDIDVTCFDAAQNFVYDILKQRYFPEFLTSVHYCKHQLDVLSEGAFNSLDILYNANLLQRFTEFLDQLGRRELIEFWLAAEMFHKQLKTGEHDVQQSVNDAMLIYDRFISMQASQPVGFDERTRIGVENMICDEAGPQKHCFASAQRIVVTTLDQMYLEQFKQSPLLGEHLSELRHTIQTSIELPSIYATRPCKESSSDVGSSDAGSTAFEYANSGLLSARSVHSGRRRLDTDQASLDSAYTGTSGSLADDLTPLWERRGAAGSQPHSPFTIAHVDRLGRYVRDYEPITPEQEGRPLRVNLGVKLKSFMHNDNQDDEAACRLADLIVRDIQLQCAGGAAPESHPL